MTERSLFPRQTIQHHSNQVYDPSTNVKKAEMELFYEDLQDLLELTPKKKKKKDFLFIIGDWSSKV